MTEECSRKNCQEMGDAPEGEYFLCVSHRGEFRNALAESYLSGVDMETWCPYCGSVNDNGCTKECNEIGGVWTDEELAAYRARMGR